jgi:hypothetical protein
MRGEGAASPSVSALLLARDRLLFRTSFPGIRRVLTAILAAAVRRLIAAPNGCWVARWAGALSSVRAYGRGLVRLNSLRS